MKFPIQQGGNDQDESDQSVTAKKPQHSLFISERDAHGSRGANDASLRIHEACFADCFIEGNRVNFPGAQAYHPPELPARGELKWPKFCRKGSANRHAEYAPAR